MQSDADRMDGIGKFNHKVASATVGHRDFDAGYPTPAGRQRDMVNLELEGILFPELVSPIGAAISAPVSSDSSIAEQGFDVNGPAGGELDLMVGGFASRNISFFVHTAPQRLTRFNCSRTQ